MPTEVLIPKLGMTMTEGKVVEWYKADGAEVRAGDMLYRLETEKIEFEVEAESDGILRHLVPVDTTLEPGAVVGYVLAVGEGLPAGLIAATPAPAAQAAAPAAQPSGAAPPSAAASGEVRASPAAKRLAKELSVDLARIRGSGPEGRVVEEDVRQAAAHPPPPAGAARPAGEPVPASPLARRLAEEHALDLSQVPGSGPGGRVTKEDVEAYLERPREAPATTAPALGGIPGPEAAAESMPYKGMRKTIGERMFQSLQSMAQLTITSDADVSELVKLRGQLVEEWSGQNIRPSYTDLIVRACAIALRDHPRLNASLEGDTIRLQPEVNIGIAVALSEGLIVPVLRAADTLSLKEITTASRDLAERTRTNKLGLDDVAGGTFNVTSLGMYDVDHFTPIVNPPNCAILGVGRVREAPGFEGEQVVRKSYLGLSLTFDHRIADGAPAAEFLRRIRQLLERPYLLVLER